MEYENSLRMVDFSKDVESWKYNRKPSINFIIDKDSISEMQDEQNSSNRLEKLGSESSTRMENVKRKEKDMDATGVFFFSRNDPIEVLATLVPAKEYNHPEVQDAMQQELQKWKNFRHL